MCSLVEYVFISVYLYIISIIIIILMVFKTVYIFYSFILPGETYSGVKYRKDNVHGGKIKKNCD